jgi:hypothetical protein
MQGIRVRGGHDWSPGEERWEKEEVVHGQTRTHLWKGEERCIGVNLGTRGPRKQ